MMFICDCCKGCTAENEKMVKRADKTRHRVYRDSLGRAVGEGYETVHEAKLCQKCARDAE